MSAQEQLIREVLDKLSIPYDVLHHDAVHSIEDCAEPGRQLNALVAKNYFLSTRNEKTFYICVVRPDARFRTSDISKQIGSSRLSFGSEEKLSELLRTYPGAVSPLGLVFDSERKVGLIIDRALCDVQRIAFHPCDSTVTFAMETCRFLGDFLTEIRHFPVFVEIHDFES